MVRTRACKVDDCVASIYIDGDVILREQNALREGQQKTILDRVDGRCALRRAVILNDALKLILFPRIKMTSWENMHRHECFNVIAHVLDGSSCDAATSIAVAETLCKGRLRGKEIRLCQSSK